MSKDKDEITKLRAVIEALVQAKGRFASSEFHSIACEEQKALLWKAATDALAARVEEDELTHQDEARVDYIQKRLDYARRQGWAWDIMVLNTKAGAPSARAQIDALIEQMQETGLPIEEQVQMSF